MEVIKNNKGGLKVLYEGYSYTKKKETKTTVRWECYQRKTRSCKGTLTTDVEVVHVLGTTDHCHTPDPSGMTAMKMRSEMKMKASTSRETQAMILLDIVSSQPVAVRAALGEKDSVKRDLRRHRAKQFPANPATLADLKIDGDWAFTSGEEKSKFLIHDNKHRVLVFASDTTLRHLASADTWYMDGTFDAAPRLFTQLYVIRVPLGDSAVSCAYALLSDKTQTTYQEVLQAIVDRCEELGFQPDPSTVITDFEMAAINAVSVILGSHVNTHGCYYHLTQSTWRKVQALGLVSHYRSNEDARIFCAMMDGLAFLPVTDVEDGLAYLKDTVPEELEPLVDYFDKTYVTGSFRQIQRSGQSTLRFRRIKPMYPPKVWNVHQITIQGGSRTNNVCEGWNHGFMKLVGHSHPTVWRLIDCLKKDNGDACTSLYRAERGQLPKKRTRPATKQLQDRLKTLCQNYANDEKSLSEFLHSIGHCMR